MGGAAFLGGLLGGFGQGMSTRMDESRERKQKLSDEEREQKLGDYNTSVTNIQQAMSNVDPGSQQHIDLRNQLADVVEKRTALFHPDQGPSAMQHLGRLALQYAHNSPAELEHVGRMVWHHHGPEPTPTTPAAPATPSTAAAPATSLPASGGITTPEMPSVPGRAAIPATSATPAYAATPGIEGTPSGTLPAMGGIAATLPAAPAPNVSAMTPERWKQRSAALQEADILGAGAVQPNPVLQMSRQIRAAFPNMTDEQVQEHTLYALGGTPRTSTGGTTGRWKQLSGAAGKAYQVQEGPNKGRWAVMGINADGDPEEKLFSAGYSPPAGTTGTGRPSEFWVDASAEALRLHGKADPSLLTADELLQMKQKQKQAVSPVITTERGVALPLEGGHVYSGTVTSTTQRSFAPIGGAPSVPGAPATQITTNRTATSGKTPEEFKHDLANVASGQPVKPSRAATTPGATTPSAPTSSLTPSTLAHPGVSINSPVPLGQRDTPAITKATEDYDAAVGLNAMAEKVQSAPPDQRAGQQKALAQMLQRIIDNRYNEHALENLKSNYGFFTNIKAYIQQASNGELPDEVVQQLIGITRMNLTRTQASLQAARGQTGGTGGGTVRMQAPDGSTKDVPPDQVQHYLSKGAKVVQ